MRGRVTVAIRPGGFVLGSGASLSAGIVARRYLGESEAFWLAIDGRGEPLRVRLREGAVAPEARRIAITPREEDVLVFESGGANA